jgi:glycosyltransferase involved in cell wall biosynthesis
MVSSVFLLLYKLKIIIKNYFCLIKIKKYIKINNFIYNYMRVNMTIDIVILTKNESNNISDCLISFKGLGRAIVIDDNSQDDTIKIAKSLGATVFEHSFENFAAQRNFSLTKISADWVFFLDADERFTPQLIDSVKLFIANNNDVAGSVARVNYAFGKRHRFGQLAPDRVIRLFPRDKVKWEGFIHERPIINLPIKSLQSYLKHYVCSNWNSYFNKLINYTKFWSDEANLKGEQSSLFKACIYAISDFLKIFIFKLGILEGPIGWIFCYYNLYYTFNKYFLLYKKNLTTK